MVFQGPGLSASLWLQGSPDCPLSPRKAPEGKQKVAESQRTLTRASPVAAHPPMPSA